ncbi:hypothetical protein LCGC14_2411770, partial [marine sediment metagenome]
LVQAVNVCQTTARNLRGLTSGRGLVEAALVRLAAAEKFVDADSLLARLEALGSPSAAPARTAGTGRAPSPAQKKNTPAPREVAATEPQPGLTDPQWELGYLQAHWPAVVAELTRSRQGQLAGMLGPAQVLGVAGATLRLGYDQIHDALRERAAGRLAEQIDSALGRLFGRDVRCEYVPTGKPGQAPPAHRQAQAAQVSSAERNGVAKDPAVRAVLDFFEGGITDIRRDAHPAAEDEER